MRAGSVVVAGLLLALLTSGLMGVLAVPAPTAAPMRAAGGVGVAAANRTVTVIPPLPGDLFTVPWGINGRGDVVGWSFSGQRAVPFLFTDAAGTRPLPTLPGRPNGTARDINDAGQIVGNLWADTLDQPGHAVRWDGATVRDLGTLGGVTSDAWGVNATGAVVGSSLNASAKTHAYLFTDLGGMIDITPNNDTGAGYDINDAGQATGYRTGFGGSFHAYRWSGGIAQDLGLLSGLGNSYGFAINAAGQVAGSALSFTGNSERLVRFTDGTGWQDLGGAGQDNKAWGMNRSGDVVGGGVPGVGGLRRAVLFTDARGLVDLNLEIDPALQLFLIQAHDINDAGQIVGYGFDNIAVQDVGVRLNPVSGPPANRPPTVTVLVPNGGETWTGGSAHAIGWTMTDSEDLALAVVVGLSTDGGGLYTTVFSGSLPVGTNTFDWTLPRVDTTIARIRVCATDSGAASTCDTSDTDFRIDSTTPILASIEPVDGAMNVTSNATIILTFSEPMNRTATEAATQTSPAVATVASWDPPGVVLTIRPTAPLDAATWYTVTVGCGAKDASDPGNAVAGCPTTRVFSTAATPRPPQLTLTRPSGGEVWTGGTVHSIDWAMSDPDGTGELTVDLSFSSDAGATWTLIAGGLVRPQGTNTFSWLVPGTDAAAVLVRACASDGALVGCGSGLPMSIDSSPPSVASVSPRDGAVGVPLGGAVVVTFSERMGPTATESAITLTPYVPGTRFSWDSGRQTLTVEFGVPLAENADYIVTVGCGAVDGSDPGNALAGCPGAPFRTEFQTQIVTAAPIARAVGVAEARVGVPVTLDGSASTGRVASWTWTVTSGAGAVLATLDGRIVSYVFADSGTYRIILRVTDVFGRSNEVRFDLVVVGDGGAWLFLAVGAGSAATILFAATEPGRVALVGATAARIYGRKPKDEKDSEIRGAILYYVRVHPGDCYMDIKRNLVLNDGVVTYHLARLEKEALIRSAIRGARKRYYPAEMRVPAENGGELHEIQQRLLRLITGEPGMPVAFLAEQLGLSYQLALYHLRKLAAADLVSLERRGWRLRTFPGPREPGIGGAGGRTTR